jgi:cytochrome c-type biogenesis protein CcsB
MKLGIFVDYQLPVIACFFLFLAMISYWISLSFPKEQKSFQIGKFFVFLSNILFFLTLFSRWIGEGYFPLSNLYESLLFLSWGISFIHLYLESKTKSRLIGALSSPLLFFISGFSSLTLPIEMQKALPLVPSLQSNWLMMHVSMMMISYATLIVGSLLSILYLFFTTFTISTFSALSFSNLGKLPIQSGITELSEKITESTFTVSEKKIETSRNSFLETIDIWSYRIIGLGFPFLTIGIISGAVWANEAWGSYWSWDPKETWAFITWLVFAIYLHSRLIKGWQGKNSAILGTAGFFVIWICYLGVNFLGKGLHSYGWVL